MMVKVLFYAYSIGKSSSRKTAKAMREKGPPRGRIPKHLSPKQRMERKLRTLKVQRIYKQRKLIEPTFGGIKFGRGFVQFLLRGIEKASREWSQICMTQNLLKLWKARPSRV
jgi:hypothetical protein